MAEKKKILYIVEAMGGGVSSICGLTILGFMVMRIVVLRSSIWLWKLQRHQ